MSPGLVPPYRIAPNKTNPATNTTTGTQNCTSVKMQIHNPRSFPIVHFLKIAAREDTTSPQPARTNLAATIIKCDVPLAHKVS
jgi:hypothetical protein